MPELTRRRLVAGGGALLAGGYGGFRLLGSRPTPDFASWSPEPGTWPLDSYDPANTAHNPHASPPRATPETLELAAVDEYRSDGGRPLVSDDHLVIGGRGLAAFTEDGTKVYQGDEGTRAAGFAPDGSLSAYRINEDREYELDTDVLGDNGADEAYPYDLPLYAVNLTVGRSATYVGTLDGGVVAYDRDDGRSWSVAGERCALAGDHLYTVAGQGERRAFRLLEDDEPEPRWTEPLYWLNAAPAVADGRIVIVGRNPTHHRFPHLAAFDADTGEQLWEPISIDCPAARLAVDGRHGYVTTGVGGGGQDAGCLARYDLESGEEVWHEETERALGQPVLAEDTLVVTVVGGPDEEIVKIRAYDTAAGDELWTVAFPDAGGVSGLALVEDRVVATAGPTMYALE